MKLSGDLLKSVCITSVLFLCCICATAEGDRFNTPGNVLIADQFNNRVIEVDRHGNIVWQFGLGPADFSPASIIGVNDAQRVGELTLMTGTGTPGGQPEAPNCTSPSGCPDNRVLLVDRSGNIVWQYGQFGVAGSGPDQLNVPVQNTWLPNRHVLITDQANERIIDVDVATKGIVWQYGSGDPNNGDPVSGVAFASRLENGHTLITDSNHARIVEIDQDKNVVWEYFTCTDPKCNQRGGTGPLPTRAVRLKNSHTLISDQYNHRVIEVNHGKQIVHTFGKINSLGYNTQSVADGGLNSPYDAKRIGDYTGLTPPFGENDDDDNNNTRGGK